MKEPTELITVNPEPVSQMPHLSYSRLNRYLTCPEQYRLHYVEGLRPKVPAASLLFGQIVHQALSAFFRSQTGPADFFQANWKETKEVQLRFVYRETWENLLERGQRLLEKFRAEEASKLAPIVASEKPFDLSITSLNRPFVGTIDLIAELEGVLTVIDFKTAGSAYAEHEVILSDQLTAYQLAIPNAEQSSLCVMVKAKEPRIEWQIGRRTSRQLTEFLMKAEIIGRSIESQCFYKRPGQWCAWCDYLPICMSP